jgi:hypothetical protein
VPVSAELYFELLCYSTKRAKKMEEQGIAKKIVNPMLTIKGSDMYWNGNAHFSATLAGVEYLIVQILSIQ